MKDTWETVDEEKPSKRKPIKRGTTWEKADDRKRETTESARYRFRERIDIVFDDFTRKDWQDIKSLYQMKTTLDMRNTFTGNTSWNQSRLAWEITKGRTYAKLQDGYTYSYHKHGIRANTRVLYNNKWYRKGQFLPKKYRTDK